MNQALVGLMTPECRALVLKLQFRKAAVSARRLDDGTRCIDLEPPQPDLREELDFHFTEIFDALTELE